MGRGRAFEPAPGERCHTKCEGKPMRKLPRAILTLKKRSDTLRTLLRQAENEYRVYKATERVREAKIQVLKAQIGEMSSVLLTALQRKRITKISLQIESLI